ncbi:MAG: alpha-isopropylmalate synthase regulatory domain-containing protein [Oscillospiraceae bacterium]
MRNIAISDITMKQAEGAALSFREKIELAKILDKLGVDVIETAPIEKPKIDSLLIKSIASAVRDAVVAVPVALSAEGIDTVWSALKEARRPRLQVVAPTSSVQMEYFCHKKPAAMLTAIRELVALSREKCPDVEFVAEDACRAERDFLYQAVAAAVEAGAGSVTVCDAAGAMLPDEFSAFIAELRAAVPALEGVTLGVRCSNDLAMADSCAVAAIRAGAGEVKAAACGEGTASLAKLARVLSVRGDSMDARCQVRGTELQRAVGQIERMCRGRRAGSPYDSGVHADSGDVVLSGHDDMAAVCRAVAALGYDLSDEDQTKVYEAFTRIAGRKERVGARELDAIVASAALQVPPTYRLESYMVNAGNLMKATAQIRLIREDKPLEGVCAGDGPIDAAFLAIEQIAGRHYELDDFQIQAVTEGREAMGETVVKLRAGGKLYSGRGISTDIIGASIRAYVNALNKIVYEEAAE